MLTQPYCSHLRPSTLGRPDFKVSHPPENRLHSLCSHHSPATPGSSSIYQILPVWNLLIFMEPSLPSQASMECSQKEAVCLLTYNLQICSGESLFPILQKHLTQIPLLFGSLPTIRRASVWKIRFIFKYLKSRSV